ncbi:ribosomal protein L20 [Mycoplasma haemofelis str. Langford 1]|uniref:Large ribosomal subunit protein bL20 n=2 Tax=Mycoplasma haemofelis TaxID=29501 RepID=F6FFM4_MYCHI|nr:50S ribosomal protein L20 [Mycoplasma haemofelis]AEG72419.1 50S ribosomal protein L20 [Mycoplasma haemofelis Ohio2]CBY92106.1 ribosomal protein L20 [Mycoplasma haemofelis str. Langford 1]
MRVAGGYSTRQRRKRVLKRAEGFWGHRHASYRTARQSVIKAAQYAFRDRKNRKRDFRRLWIQRINAAARMNGITYSALIKKLHSRNIQINRKLLSELAIHQPEVFKSLCQ